MGASEQLHRIREILDEQWRFGCADNAQLPACRSLPFGNDAPNALDAPQDDQFGFHDDHPFAAVMILMARSASRIPFIWNAGNS